MKPKVDFHVLFAPPFWRGKKEPLGQRRPLLPDIIEGSIQQPRNSTPEA